MLHRPLRLFALVLASLGVATTAHAHTRLIGSSPSAGARLVASPAELRLRFSEAVSLPFCEVTLLASDSSEVVLGSLARAPDSADVLIAPLRSELPAGEYRVRWRVAGLDGHVIRGTYAFTVAGPPRDSLAVPSPPAPPGVAATPEVARDAPAASSPAYALVRSFTYACTMVLIGAVVFVAVVLPPAVRESSDGDPTFAPAAIRAAHGLAFLAGIGLLLAAGARLLAQSAALADYSPLAAEVRLLPMLASTWWGLGWMLQVGGALVALLGLATARRRGTPGWTLVATASLLVALAPAFSGHAIATSRWTPVAILADALHVLAVSAWLGTLLVLIIAGVGVALRLSPGSRGVTAAALVRRFSPIALASAATAVVTGLFAAWQHLGSIDALRSSAYGQLLIVKLALVALVAGVGAFNWRRMKPAMSGEAGARAIRRSAAVELAFAAAVVIATAVLVATPPPSESLPRARQEQPSTGR